MTTVRRRGRERGVFAALVALLVAVPAAAWADLSATTSQTNTFGAGVLYAPGTVSTQHVEAVSNDGSVSLTWSETSGPGTLAPPSYQVLRATAGPSPSFAAVATLTAGSANNSTTANCNGSTCTWTDNPTNDASNPPGFNSQYEYEVQSYAGGFTAGPGSPYDALSMTPTSGTDETKSASSETLYGVSASTAQGPVLAVGQAGTIYVCVYGSSTCDKGSTADFTLQAQPVPSPLYAVAYNSATDAWAVGGGGTILHCTLACGSSSGTTWAQVQSGLTANDLHGIYYNGTIGWVVGASGTVLSYSGGTWSVVNGTGNTNNLTGVTVLADSSVMAVGAGPTILRCASSCTTGANWAAQSAPSGSGTLESLAADGTGTIAVGLGSGSGRVIYQTSATGTWTAETSGTITHDLYAVSGYAGNYVAVGANGLVLYCSASCDATAPTWTVEPISGVTAQLQAVSHTNGMVYVVGATNTAYVLDNGGNNRNDAGSPKSVTYNLGAADLTDLQDINATPTPYVTSALPASLPSPSSCAANDLEVGFTSPVNAGPVGFAHAVVDYELSSASSASSSLLVSVNDGSTWTSAGSLGTPTTSYQVVNLNVASEVGAVTTGAAEVQLCLQFAGTGSPTASVQQVHLDVDANPASTPSFTSASSTSFAVGAAGSFTVTASGAPSPSITESGALPSGVSFTGGTGSATLSGTPASGTGGAYPVTFTATNAIGSTPQSFTLTVDYAPSITSAGSTTFTVASAGSFTVSTTGLPTASISQSTGNGQTGLPSWATFADNGNGTASLSGTPPTGSAGNYTFTIAATNSAGTASQSFTLTVSSLVFAGLGFTSTTQSNGATLSCSNQGTATVSCTAQPLGGTGSFSAEVELVNGSGTAVTNTSGLAITVSAAETTVSSPGGSVSPASLQIANGSSATASKFTLTGLGGGWKATMTCTVIYGGSTYTIAVTGN
jgi:hypothetical protein